MPVEIRELVIRATVHEGKSAPAIGGGGGGGCGACGGHGAHELKPHDRAEIVHSVIEQVVQLLKNGKER
jgi:Family of unknown function (DUF5908)